MTDLSMVTSRLWTNIKNIQKIKASSGDCKYNMRLYMRERIYEHKLLEFHIYSSSKARLSATYFRLTVYVQQSSICMLSILKTNTVSDSFVNLMWSLSMSCLPSFNLQQEKCWVAKHVCRNTEADMNPLTQFVMTVSKN